MQSVRMASSPISRRCRRFRPCSTWPGGRLLSRSSSAYRLAVLGRLRRARSLEGAGVTVCPQVFVHRAAWGDASALGLTVTEYEPRGRAVAEQDLAPPVKQPVQT